MTTIEAAARPDAEQRRFHLGMAIAFAVVAFGGFVPTYWAPVVTGAFHASPVIHLHGALMFAWVSFYVVQTAFVASGRTMDHRAWGLAGISLFSVLACGVLVGTMAVIKREEALGAGDAALRFSAITLCGWPLLVGLFGAAIALRNRAAWHKRLMVVLMSAMMTPAIARVFLTLLAPPGAAGGGSPPPFVTIPPSLAADLFIVVAMIHDRRTLGRIHPAYKIGGLIVLAQQMLTVPFASTDLWMRIARGFEALAG